MGRSCTSRPSQERPGEEVGGDVLLHLPYTTAEMEFPSFILFNGLCLVDMLKPSVFLICTVLNIDIFQNYF